ncbi:MAG: tRNA glutamyl-Q(34) synthetase GluQRS, partial [Chromatiales bacterium]|nr:tRNA glutamyl-Q(34) synthetase GluQRS [Chromatiales bacterium]
QQYLGLSTPSYLHLPLVINDEGKKLSKQDGARPVDASDPLPALIDAYKFLGQQSSAYPANLEEFWTMARAEWDLSLVPGPK